MLKYISAAVIGCCLFVANAFAGPCNVKCGPDSSQILTSGSEVLARCGTKMHEAKVLAVATNDSQFIVEFKDETYQKHCGGQAFEKGKDLAVLKLVDHVDTSWWGYFGRVYSKSDVVTFNCFSERVGGFITDLSESGYAKIQSLGVDKYCSGWISLKALK